MHPASERPAQRTNRGSLLPRAEPEPIDAEAWQNAFRDESWSQFHRAPLVGLNFFSDQFSHAAARAFRVIRRGRYRSVVCQTAF